MAPILKEFAQKHRNVWVQAISIAGTFDIDKPVLWGPQGRHSVTLKEIDGTPYFAVVTPWSGIRAQRSGTLGSRSDFSLFELEAWCGSAL